LVTMFNPVSSNNEDTQQEKTEMNSLRRKRDEYVVEISKKKREEYFKKKRYGGEFALSGKTGDSSAPTSHNLAQDPQLRELVDQWLKRVYDVSELFSLVEAAASNDRMKQHYGVIGLRKVLSNDQGPPIQSVIDANMVPRLINFMQDDKEPHLQLEAAWALTNIASGTTQQTQSIIDKGGIPCFIKLLSSNKLEIAEQAIWAIGNIAGDSSTFRDLILKLQGLRPLLYIVDNTTNKVITKHGTWAISNLCRGKPLPELELVDIAIPTLANVVQRETDVDVLTDATWALSYLSRHESKVGAVVATGVVPALVHLLDNPYLALLIPCLRTLGNIVTGSEDETNTVLREQAFLPKLFALIDHKKKAVRRETCWTLSNITAGNPQQIETIMGVGEYVEKIITIALKDIPEVKREASWILSNATKNSNPEQIARMVQSGVLDCFVALLDGEDAKTTEVVLEGLNNILNWGAVLANQQKSSENFFLIELENKGGVKKIEDLQTHPNNEVYLKALKILENHFELESLL